LAAKAPGQPASSLTIRQYQARPQNSKAQLLTGILLAHNAILSHPALTICNQKVSGKGANIA